MSEKQTKWTRLLAPPLVAVLVLAFGAATVAGVSKEDLTAEDGAVIVEDGKHRQTLTRTLPIPDGTHVNLRTSNGKIHVTSWDKNELHITAEKRMEVRVGGLGWVLNKLNIPVGQNDEAADAFFEAVKVGVDVQDDTVDVKTIIPKNRPNVSVAVHYDVKVPRNTHVKARTSNGRIQLAALDGEVETRTSNGRIEVDDVSGPVRAETSNGSVNLHNVRGPIQADTSNGSIEVAGAVTLAAGHTIACDTSNGSIGISLPPDAAFNVEAKTSNGRIRCDFDVRNERDRDSRRRLHGTVNGGGPKLELETSNGSIRIGQN